LSSCRSVSVLQMNLLDTSSALKRNKWGGLCVLSAWNLITRVHCVTAQKVAVSLTVMETSNQCTWRVFGYFIWTCWCVVLVRCIIHAILFAGLITVTSPPTRPVGSIADLDPVNNFYGSLATDYRPPSSGTSANNYNNHNMSTPINNQNQQTKLASSGVRFNFCNVLNDYVTYL
jgi:hypothetical protein